MTPAPPIESRPIEVEPIAVAAASECINLSGSAPSGAPNAKANLPLPEIMPSWRRPCGWKFFRVNFHESPSLRVDWFVNLCGDIFWRVTDDQGERWTDEQGRPVQRPW